MKDEKYMRLALNLAEKGCGKVNPNPLVGAVIVKNSKVIGKGYHMEYGGFHAEREAISSCCECPEGADMYVTLEPCPMCAGAIINARIKRVVYGAEDPKAGCCGTLLDLFDCGFNHRPAVERGVLQEESAKLLRAFFKKLRNRS